MSDPMTAADLCDLVRAWTEKQRPDGVWLAYEDPQTVGFYIANHDGSYTELPLSIAILAHEASGMRWFATRDDFAQGPIHGFNRRTGEWFYGAFTGPSLLHAIDAAIKEAR